eukprot:TRINITY_DN2539_c0_g1_i1.p2 TRINITY_DN2539_c0_g1~~TRINITY_DN2539_c0_g1_i1.p2  ORF type:complete len:57 (+),score=4.45 TRINITY_DN2539_c0_g1_i1:47-217(+)
MQMRFFQSGEHGLLSTDPSDGRLRIRTSDPSASMSKSGPMYSASVSIHIFEPTRPY